VSVIQVKVLVSSVFSQELLAEGVQVESVVQKYRLTKASVSLTHQLLDVEWLEML